MDIVVVIFLSFAFLFFVAFIYFLFKDFFDHFNRRKPKCQHELVYVIVANDDNTFVIEKRVCQLCGFIDVDHEEVLVRISGKLTYRPNLTREDFTKEPRKEE